MKTPLQTVLEHKKSASSLLTVRPTATVASAVDLLNSNKIGSVLVMDGDRLVGIFTERDVLRRVVGGRMDPEKTTISQVMTRELVVMKPSSTVEDAMSVISERRVRHLPVVEGGKVLGVISQGDLNHWLIRNREVHIEQLVDYITGRYPA
jgi:CBS domain-containing protein